MNHEFEWRKQMRKLGGPLEPARELWPDIAARIAGAPARTTSHRRTASWLAMAATLAVAVGAGVIAYRGSGNATPDASTQASAHIPAVSPAASTTSTAERQRTALDWAMPADPALAATAQNLDNASAQLQGALEQRPDAVFLVGLLNRTNSQRLRLMRKSPYAG